MRLIDAHGLDILGYLEEFPACENDKAWNAAIREVCIYVNLAPTVDAVPVVRCKDCKYCDIYNTADVFAICRKTGETFIPFGTDIREHFCGYGERKESKSEA